MTLHVPFGLRDVGMPTFRGYGGQMLRDPAPYGTPACAYWAAAVGWDMYYWQDGRCAFCGWKVGKLYRDHDHATGLIRGLLCPSCNVREGYGWSDDWRRYREGLNPAEILGVEELYF